MKDTTKQKLKTEIKRFIKFFICTELAWLVDLGIFTLLFELIGLDYILCKAVSYTCGAITSYTLNKKLTFMDANPVDRLAHLHAPLQDMVRLQRVAVLYVLGGVLFQHKFLRQQILGIQGDDKKCSQKVKAAV